MKEDILDITLDDQGAVSERVVIQMAETSLQILKTDFSLAVTGIAGPGGGSDQNNKRTSITILVLGDGKC